MARRDDVVHVSYEDFGFQTARAYGRPRSPYAPRRSSSFDVAPDGAVPTPRSFKGYTLGAYARNSNTAMNEVHNPGPARNSPVSPRAFDLYKTPDLVARPIPSPRKPPAVLQTSPVSDAGAPREAFHNARSFTLFDEVDLGGPMAQTAPPAPKDEQGELVCGSPIIGPTSPAFGKLSQRALGWSTVLHDATLIAFRTVMALLAIAAAVTSAALGWRRRAYFISNYTAVAAIVAARMLAHAVRYRSRRANVPAANAPHTLYGFDAAVYQTNLTLLAYASVVFMMSFIWPPAARLTAAPTAPIFDASATLLLLVTVASTMDVWVTPIPFRLTYVPIAALYNTMIALLAVGRLHTRAQVGVMIAIPGLLSLALGFGLLLYARSVYRWVHRERIIYALKTPVAPAAAAPPEATV